MTLFRTPVVLIFLAACGGGSDDKTPVDGGNNGGGGTVQTVAIPVTAITIINAVISTTPCCLVGKDFRFSINYLQHYLNE